MTLIDIPEDFGKGGANLSEGETTLRTILANHNEEIDASTNAGQQALGQSQAALLRGIRRYASFEVYTTINEQPADTVSVALEFNQGQPLSSDARFLIAHFRLVQAFDNVGHTEIRAAIGTHDDPEKYASFVSISDVGQEGKTFTSAGDGGLFLLAPIASDTVVLTVESDDDLNTITQGMIATDLFYSTP